MKHNELLERIKIPYVAIGGFSWQIEQALRAVVELHKPEGLATDPKCYECQGLDPIDYPCQTIRLIEKQLNG